MAHCSSVGQMRAGGSACVPISEAVERRPCGFVPSGHVDYAKHNSRAGDAVQGGKQARIDEVRSDVFFVVTEGEARAPLDE